MSMKKWTDQELLTTRDNLETVKNRENAGQNSKLGLVTALIGALAISTGVAFIFIDGVDVFTVILIIMGVLTCFSWFRNDKRRRDNIALLSEINKEIKSRKLDESAKKLARRISKIRLSFRSLNQLKTYHNLMRKNK